MYSDAFCKVYNEFGWNYFPEAFGEQLIVWLERRGFAPRSALDLGCGTGVLCEAMHAAGMDVRGMDLSQGMIDIARSRNGHIHYDVADMLTYHPGKTFDLITCTGDALNHILDLSDVDIILKNIYGWLNPGGCFLFDILCEKEVPSSDPIELPFSDEVTAYFHITQDKGIIALSTTVYEKGEKAFEEKITETVHDADAICSMLKNAGFVNITRAHQLLDDIHSDSSTWYISAEKA